MGKGDRSADVVSWIFLVIGLLAGMFLLFVVVTDRAEKPNARAPQPETTAVSR